MNYYEMLGVPARGLTKEELSEAKKVVFLKYHPDKNPNEDTTELFIEAKRALDILKDEKLRFAYDVYA